MLKGTASKETVETRSYGKKLFMVKFPEFFGSTSYMIILRHNGPVIRTSDTGTDIEKTAPLTNIAWSYM